MSVFHSPLSNIAEAVRRAADEAQLHALDTGLAHYREQRMVQGQGDGSFSEQALELRIIGTAIDAVRVAACAFQQDADLSIIDA